MVKYGRIEPNELVAEKPVKQDLYLFLKIFFVNGNLVNVLKFRHYSLSVLK